MARRTFGSVTATLLLAAGLAVGLPSTASATGGWQEFEGSGFGTVADGGGGSCPSPGAPRDVTFSVSGLAAERLADVRVTDLRISHPYVGDVSVTLIAPDGVTQRVLFARTGAAAANAVGDSSDLVGPYTFTDDPAGPGGWWAAAAATSDVPMPSGEYYASQSGGADASRGTAASLTGAFGALASPNGTWTLRVVDNCSPDVGTVVAARLVLRTVSQVCAIEEGEVAFAGTQVAAATTAAAAAATARTAALAAAAKAAAAVVKAAKAVTKAPRRKRPAARARLARAQVAHATASGRAEVAVERLRAATVARQAAADRLLREEEALAICEHE